MTIFVVVAIKEADKISAAISGKIADSDSYKLTDDVWLVDFSGTARGLAEELGIRGGEAGTGIVFPTTNFSGRASRDIWEWLQAHMTEREASA
jgi:hypothetical protein